jgi:hypothetical protein
MGHILDAVHEIASMEIILFDLIDSMERIKETFP